MDAGIYEDDEEQEEYLADMATWRRQRSTAKYDRHVGGGVGGGSGRSGRNHGTESDEYIERCVDDAETDEVMPRFIL